MDDNWLVSSRGARRTVAACNKKSHWRTSLQENLWHLSEEESPGSHICKLGRTYCNTLFFFLFPPYLAKNERYRLRKKDDGLGFLTIWGSPPQSITRSSGQVSRKWSHCLVLAGKVPLILTLSIPPLELASVPPQIVSYSSRETRYGSVGLLEPHENVWHQMLERS